MTLGSDSGTGAINAQMLLHNFFNETEPQARDFTIDASRMTIIVGTQGIRFSFQPFSFQDLTGQPVRGEVQLQLREIFRKGDMILANRMATSEDRLLECAGQFGLFAFQNGLPLETTQPITVEVPVHYGLVNPVGMRLFVGSHSTVLPYDAEKIFDWKLVNDKPLKIKKLHGKKYFQFTISEFNWYGCQCFYAKKSGRAMVSARYLSDLEDFDDQAAFLVFQDIQSVARMYLSGQRFTAFNMPTGLSATVVIIAVKERQLYLGIHAINNLSSQLVQVPAVPLSVQQLLGTLQEL